MRRAQCCHGRRFQFETTMDLAPPRRIGFGAEAWVHEFHGGIAPQKLVTGAPYLAHTAAPQHGLEVITAEVLSAAPLPLHLGEPRADERRPGGHEEDYQRVAS